MYHIAIVQATYLESESQRIGKVMADAFYSALAAFVIGVCLGGTMKEFDGGSLAGTVFLGAFVIFAVFWTRRAVRRLLSAKYTTSEFAKRSGRQWVLFCLCFTMSAAAFGIAVKAVTLHPSDGFYPFPVLVFGSLACVQFYAVYREARRLTSALL
jgi:hypothetical protein